MSFKESFKMEYPRETTKLLVPLNNSDYLKYHFGFYDVFVTKVEPIIKQGPPLNRPTIITVRYDCDKDLAAVIETNNKYFFTVKRVFKSAKLSDDESMQKFINNCAKNLVYLCKGRMVRVICKNNKKLQKQFFDAMVKANVNEGTLVKFDYDTWEVAFNIKLFKLDDGSQMIVTYAEGLDYLDE